LSGLPSDLTVDCDAIGSIPDGSNVTATDNCDSNVQVEITETQEASNCANSFVLIRTFTATDDCGNVATGSKCSS